MHARTACFGLGQRLEDRGNVVANNVQVMEIVVVALVPLARAIRRPLRHLVPDEPRVTVPVVRAYPALARRLVHPAATKARSCEACAEARREEAVVESTSQHVLGEEQHRAPVDRCDNGVAAIVGRAVRLWSRREAILIRRTAAKRAPLG
eukprot:667687-Prymnesium_polylepis.1